MIVALWWTSLAHAEHWEEDRTEILVGFVGGNRAPSAAPFAQVEGTPSASFTAPLSTGVPMGTLAFGPSWEARLVASQVRFALGLNALWPDWPDEAVSGALHGLRGQEVVFGLGVEPPIGPVTPFVDVLGSMTHWTADLPVGDAETQWKSDGFVPSVRLGARLSLEDHVFVETAASVSPFDVEHWDVAIRAGVACF